MNNAVAVPTKHTPSPRGWEEGVSPAPLTHATGPRTAEGKSASARNATTHGLFARDTVLPAHGENPADYEQLLAELTRELRPRTVMQQHAVETIAGACWRLRRFARWQRALYDAPDLTDDERLHKLNTVLRHESALYRRIDRALKLLNRDLPALEPFLTPPSLDDNKNCQNEPTPATSPPPLTKGRAGEGSLPKAGEGFVNSSSSPVLNREGAGGGSLPPPIRIAQTRCAKRKQRRH